MKVLSNLIIAVALLATIASCKDTKKEKIEENVSKETIEKIEAVETELETITDELEQKANELDNSLQALDDI